MVFQSFSHLQPTFWSNADSSVIIYLGSTRLTAILCWHLPRRTVFFSGYFSPEYTGVGICKSQDLDALSSNGVALSSGGIQLSYSIWLAYPCHIVGHLLQSVCLLFGRDKKKMADQWLQRRNLLVTIAWMFWSNVSLFHQWACCSLSLLLVNRPNFLFIHRVGTYQTNPNPLPTLVVQSKSLSSGWKPMNLSSDSLIGLPFLSRGALILPGTIEC